MADQPLLPPEGQYPGFLFDARFWGTILGGIGSVVPALTDAKIGKLSAALAGLAGVVCWVVGQRKSGQRQKVQASTLTAVAKASPGDTVVVPLPNGTATIVSTDPNPKP